MAEEEQRLTDLQKEDLARQIDRGKMRIKDEIEDITGTLFDADLLLPLVLRLKYLEILELGFGLGCGDLPARFAENSLLLGAGVKVRDEATILKESEERMKKRGINSQ